MTGRGRLPATLEYFVILMDLFRVLTTGLVKDVHLYFMLKLRRLQLIGGR